MSLGVMHNTLSYVTCSNTHVVYSMHKICKNFDGQAILKSKITGFAASVKFPCLKNLYVRSYMVG